MSAYQGQVPDTRPDNWRAAAICREIDAELFFPKPGDFRGINAAKAWCAACPVRDACLTAALTEEGGRAKDNRYGIRGGTAPGQRYAIYTAARKRQQRVAS